MPVGVSGSAARMAPNTSPGFSICARVAATACVRTCAAASRRPAHDLEDHRASAGRGCRAGDHPHRRRIRCPPGSAARGRTRPHCGKPAVVLSRRGRRRKRGRRCDLRTDDRRCHARRRPGRGRGRGRGGSVCAGRRGAPFLFDGRRPAGAFGAHRPGLRGYPPGHRRRRDRAFKGNARRAILPRGGGISVVTADPQPGSRGPPNPAYQRPGGLERISGLRHPLLARDRSNRRGFNRGNREPERTRVHPFREAPQPLLDPWRGARRRHVAEARLPGNRGRSGWPAGTGR